MPSKKWREKIKKYFLGEDIAGEISEGDDINPEKLKMIISSLPRPSQLLPASNLPFYDNCD